MNNAIRYGNSLMITLLSGLLITSCKPPEMGKITKPVPATTAVPSPVPESVCASSFQEEADWAHPRHVLDGNPATRWSSAFSDDEWIEFDFGKSVELAGLSLHWEQAYAEQYDIQISDDGNDWQTVYEERTGDGGLDDIFFMPVHTRYVRVLGSKRGSVFGYSLWEVNFRGADEGLLLTASSSAPGTSPESLLDADSETGWRSGNEATAWVQLDFQKPHPCSSLFLVWGDDYPRRFSVEACRNGVWEEVYTDSGREGLVKTYFEPVTSGVLRVVCDEPGPSGCFGLMSLGVGSADAGLTAVKFFELAAERHPGCYPRWLTGRQAFWTVLGVPGDEKESIFCEDGTIEPFKRGYTLMPLLYDDGRLVSRDQAQVSQSLADGNLPVPSVCWEHPDVQMDITALAFGKPGESSVLVRYRIANTGKKERSGKLYILLRPFQLYPPWQGEGEGENRAEGKGLGGMTTVRSIERMDYGLRVDGVYDIQFMTQPDAWGTSGSPKLAFPFRDTLMDNLQQGEMPAGKGLRDDEAELASAVWEYGYRLGPGQSRDICMALPLYEKRSVEEGLNEKQAQEYFTRIEKAGIDGWKTIVERLRVAIPEPDFVDTLKVNLGYTLITQDMPALQPGSWCYDKAWIRDGTIAEAALLRLGFYDAARQFIEWYASHQFESGEIPCVIDNKAANPYWEGISEYDSQGQFVFGVMEYYRFTRDREFLNRMFPRVIRALEFAEQLRQVRLTEEYQTDAEKKLMYGLISNSYARHNYCDNLWTLRGWEEGREMALLLGEKEKAAWMQQNYDALRKAINTSINHVLEYYNIDYIPEYPEGKNFWPASIAMGVACAHQADAMPQVALRRTMEKTYERLQKWKSSGEYRFTPEEMPIAEAFLYLGWKERSLEFLRFMLAHQKPKGWKQWPEVVNSEERKPTIFGDMPHTWVSAQYTLALCALFAYEKDRSLVVGAGIAPEWVEQGVSFENLHTWYGEISIRMKRTGPAVIEVRLGGTANPPEGILLRSPLPIPVREAVINGKTVIPQSADSGLQIRELPAVISLHY